MSKHKFTFTHADGLSDRLNANMALGQRVNELYRLRNMPGHDDARDLLREQIENLRALRSVLASTSS